MKIEELSIGNLVSYRGEIYSIFSISSSETVELYDYILYDYIYNIFSCNVNELEPIKLTEELLIKNGFFHDFDTEVAYPDDSMFLVSPDKQITLHNAKDYINSENIWSVHIDNSDFNSIANCELSYIHQLQNLCSVVNFNLDLKI
jgi:hypothetical protein